MSDFTKQQLDAITAVLSSRTDTRMPVTTCDTPKDRLKYLNGTLGMAWRAIANLDDYRGIPAGTLSSIASGKKEVPKKYRAQLGLPPLGDVIYLYGYMPTGEAISIGAILCECGQLFISNHPARRKCFICNPYKGRRK